MSGVHKMYFVLLNTKLKNPKIALICTVSESLGKFSQRRPSRLIQYRVLKFFQKIN